MTPKPVRETKHTRQITAARFSRDGGVLAHLWIEGLHDRAAGHEFVDDRDRRRLAKVVGVGLERKPPRSNNGTGE